MKKTMKIVCALATLLLLSGCTFKSGDELLAVPKPTKDYQALETELKKTMDAGNLIYTAPKAGENRSTVQLKDLDGDGEDEAIAFFRGRDTENSNKFTVVVYRKTGDAYVKMSSISGVGTAIQSVEYPTFTEAGGSGIVIAWRLTQSESAMELTVCGYEGGKLFPVLDTDFIAYQLSDMNGNGTRELITLNSESGGKKRARLYAYENGTMRLAGEAALSSESKVIDRVTAGAVLGRHPAVFVESKNESGVGLLTDILIYNDWNGFRNIVPESGQHATFSTYRPLSVYAADVNGDGVTEVPRAILMAGFEADTSDALFLLDWYAYGGERPVLACTTYNSQSEEWRLMLPESWHDTVTISRTNSASGMSCTTFEIYNPDGANVPLLNLYYLTGDLRTYYTENDSMYVLRETSSAIYAISIPSEAEGNPLAITREQAEARFGLIAAS